MIVCKEVIITDLKIRGSGKDARSPVRGITEVYDKEGHLIAECDHMGLYTMEQMLDFGQYIQQQENTDILDTFNKWKSNQ